MDRAWEMLEYLGEHPTADAILAAVHLKPGKGGKTRKAPTTKGEAISQMCQLGGMLGDAVGSAPMPAHLKQLAKWALDMQSKMNGKKKAA